MTRIMCNRKVLYSFLTNTLEEDDRLDFLFHLDDCPNCWDAVYNAAKAEHPHFYKRPSKRASNLALEIKDPDIEVVEENEDEEVFEVA